MFVRSFRIHRFAVQTSLAFVFLYFSLLFHFLVFSTLYIGACTLSAVVVVFPFDLTWIGVIKRMSLFAFCSDNDEGTCG